MTYIKATAAVVLTAAALLLAGGAFLPKPFSGYPESTSPPDPIVTVQDRLKQTPGNWPLWAQLGQLYLEQARSTANPALYAKAEGAFDQSYKLNQADNFSALTGLGALANTRHDFAAAATLARQALVLNPQHSPAYGVLADALTQLGLPAEATAAVQQMLDLDPGLPALSRAAYDLEQHGRPAESRALWQRALHDAQGPQAAFIHDQLGNLAYHSGDLTSAQASYLTAIRTTSPSAPTAPTSPATTLLIHIPSHVIHRPVDHVTVDVDQQTALIAAATDEPLPRLDATHGVTGWHGLAKVSVALGQTDRARKIYAILTAARPDPVLLAEYAALLAGPEREEQLALADAALALLTTSGATDDLAAAQVAIAHGNYADAVTLAQHEWQRRKHADVADMLAWSLHLAGHDAEAIGFANQALSLGIQHREYLSHRNAIEESPS